MALIDVDTRAGRKAIALHEAAKLTRMVSAMNRGTVVNGVESLSPDEIVEAAQAFYEFLDS